MTMSAATDDSNGCTPLPRPTGIVMGDESDVERHRRSTASTVDSGRTITPLLSSSGVERGVHLPTSTPTRQWLTSSDANGDETGGSRQSGWTSRPSNGRPRPADGGSQ